MVLFKNQKAVFCEGIYLKYSEGIYLKTCYPSINKFYHTKRHFDCYNLPQLRLSLIALLKDTSCNQVLQNTSN